MKKILSLVLALAMMLSLCSFAAAEGFNGEIKIWVAENTVEFTRQQVENFKALHPEYANMTVIVDPVGEGDAAYTTYTTYLLGQGAIDYCDCGAKVPNETWRDPHTDGGMDELITRQRKLYAPRGFSFVQPGTPIVSPTDAQLSTAARWTLVKDNEGSGFYPTKAIPIARIISRG